MNSILSLNMASNPNMSTYVCVNFSKSEKNTPNLAHWGLKHSLHLDEGTCLNPCFCSEEVVALPAPSAWFPHGQHWQSPTHPPPPPFLSGLHSDFWWQKRLSVGK